MKERQQLETEQLLQKTLECYLGAIETIQKHAVELSPVELTDYCARLGTVGRDVFADTSISALDQSRQSLDEVVGEYSAKIARLIQTNKAELTDIVLLLRDATVTLSARTARYDDRFRVFVSSLEETVECDNLRDIKLKLTEQVTQLRTCVEEMCAGNAAAFGELVSQLKTTESKLEEAEKLASTDPLTGLLNRREATRQAQERIRRRIPFCFILIDLNHFKWINDRHGHQCGDEVLKLIANKLREQVRPSDTISRWGGDEFLIVMNCTLPDALRRSQQMAQRLRGRFPVDSMGSKVLIEVNASAGVAQYQTGESLEATFERADQMLYQIKQQR